MNLGLDAAIRTLLLPVKPGTGEEYAQRAEDILTDMGVAENHSDWVNLETTEWEVTGVPSAPFQSFVTRLLYSPEDNPATFALDFSVVANAATAEILASFSSKYFEMHERIMADEKCSNLQARRILSHAHSLVLFASGAQMTASRISTMLQNDGIVMGRGWSTPNYILSKCGLSKRLDVQVVSDLYTQDAQGEPDLLGDLDLKASIFYVSEVCRKFGYSGDLVDQLNTLFLDHLHPPYLCILHFQLTIQSYYNHRLTNAYEFEPRGERVLWLANKYNEAGLNVGQSPFLNNAKAVDRLDEAWASSKKKRERPAARALVDLLLELDGLSDPSRTAAGQYIRALLHRMIRVNYENGRALSQTIPEFGIVEAQRLLRGVAAGNTGTRGIIEQRLADCIALFEADDLGNWKARGFGDSVFTTNTSQKKLGDVELKHITDSIIVAIEAHGGRLTEKYVYEHIATMRNVLPMRLAELEDRVPIDEWRLELQFVAHSLDPLLPTEFDVEGLQVIVQYRQYEQFRNWEVNDRFLEILESHFIVPLNAVHVHPSVRQRVLDLI
jgi:hypothetical protein